MALTYAEALEQINRSGTQRTFRVSGHCRTRMRQRGGTQGVIYEDIEYGLMMAKSCQLQANGSWQVPTSDLDGDALLLIVAIEDGVLVITLF